jgi:SAM-dependent methyltransferase
MIRGLDVLTSSTLKHLRERWWDEAFTSFLEEILRPKAGKRILDVGCGNGTAEASLARLRLSQVQFFGVDMLVHRLAEASQRTRGMNARVGYAAADACHLPFADGTFDSTFCVAVLQHICNPEDAVAEFARVTRPGGRVLAVEPDNASRYWFSSLESGVRAFELSRAFFRELSSAQGETTAVATGPMLPGLMAAHGLEPIAVHIFPVSLSHLGVAAGGVWATRRSAIEEHIAAAPASMRSMGAGYLHAIDRYAADAKAAGPAFVEIQNTLLFATLAERAAGDER